jgi:periplasmic protein TonB
VRTAIAYLTSLLCHGAVLIPLAHVSAWSATPPRYSMQRGGPASLSVRASLAAPGDAADLDDTQTLVSALPLCGQARPESPPLLAPKLVVLPETKILARVDFNAKASKPASLKPQPTPVAAAKRATASKIEATAAVSHKPMRGATAGLSSSAGNTAGQANRAHPQPTQHARRGRGSTGSNATSAAGSAGNAGGGQVDQAASPVASNPVPPYPADALARGVEGLVLLRVRIGADGTVEAATIDQPSGTPSLDESALSTVRHHWHFEPATRCGVAVSYEAILPIRFTIRRG